jgi:hypothetical protein
MVWIGRLAYRTHRLLSCWGVQRPLIIAVSSSARISRSQLAGNLELATAYTEGKGRHHYAPALLGYSCSHMLMRVTAVAVIFSASRAGVRCGGRIVFYSRRTPGVLGHEEENPTRSHAREGQGTCRGDAKANASVDT